MFAKKKIIIVTSTRADYGKLKSIILKIQKNKKFFTKIYVTGMHNLNLYGKTLVELKKDKIKNLYVHKNQSTKSTMNEILVNTIQNFSKFISVEKPDLVIVHGDRIEPLACTISSLLNNIKIAHIEGGEVSGTLDEILRHAITKLSQIHFVSNKMAKRRLIQMGEDKKNIYVTGSPDVDIILKKNQIKLSYVKKRYDINFNEYAIAILHPVVTNSEYLEKEVKIFFSSLVKSKKNFIITYPNNDVGSDIIFKEINRLKKNKNFKIFPSIRFEYFLSLLKNSEFIIGNSSCGLMEAPYYGIPTINLGDRQKNRTHNKNVFNINFNEKIIIQTIEKVKKIKIKKNTFFGTGNADKRIIKLLNLKKFWDTNFGKSFVDMK